ncbi:hypothetical protein [Qipengyuania gaetbuli]|uniref:hypothetical protein n=1 Tax=Qipengyuania gaetbuli TaxID=266952 RepID=UPI001CD5528B|nr:hypothetical protein [Qipengyuania gaetbuli]MCA0910735.1 hypothetical protein [Qipengyuania gaetbuli]
MRKFIVTGGLAIVLAACGGAAETDNAAPAEAKTTADAATEAAQPAYGEGDALVAGTDYNATTLLKCGFDNAAPEQTCEAGIKRNWGEEGQHLIEVSKPDGFKRAIFLRGTEPYGADSAQADGSAGWDFATTRDGDQVTVKFGPETYVLVDAMVTGG